MSVQIERRNFNVTEYYRMVEAGILSDDDRVELIEGEVVNMSPIGSRHAACVDRLNRLLHEQVKDLIIRVQSPIRLDDYSEPQPDVVLLKPREDYYAEGHPTPLDVLLLIEVADTSVDFDRKVKVPLYARAELREVWLVDLLKDVIEVYKLPEINGRYRKPQRVGRGESLETENIPHLSLRVDSILG